MTLAAQRRLVALGLSLLTLGTHQGVRYGQFLHYDDDLFVTGNPFVRQGLSWRSVVWAFQADLVYESPFADYWAPLTVLSRLVDVQLFGLDPGFHHLTNLALHALSVALAFLVFERLTGAFWRSAFVAAVFAVHPLHVEPVAWVAARKDMLSGALWLATIGAYLAYTRSPTRTRYAVLLASFVLGLMAKPMIMTLPFVLLLLDYWPLNRRPLGSGLLREKAPLFALTAASMGVTIAANFHVSLVSAETLPLGARIENAMDAYVSYLTHALWPSGLGVGYPHTAGVMSVSRLAICALVLVSVSLVALATRRTRPYLLVGWCWFLGTVLPTIGIVQSGVQGRADRYVYLPLFGISLALAWLVGDWVSDEPGRRRAVAVGAPLGVLALAVVSHGQVGHWASDLTLFSRAVAVIDGNSIGHNGLGATYQRMGDLGRAEAEFREALRIKPDFVGVVRNLTLLLVRLGRADEATGLVVEGLSTWARPGTRAASELHFNLGLIHAAQRRIGEAQAAYEETLRLNPYNWAALYNSGNLLAAEGRFADAEARYVAARRLNPDDAESATNLGLALLLQGRTNEAVGELAEATRIDPANGRFHTNLGRALVAAQRMAEGMVELQAGARLAPGSSDAHFQLGQALETAGQLPAARQSYQEALARNPADPEARARLEALGPP